MRTSSLSLAAERTDSLLEESLIVSSEEEARVVGARFNVNKKAENLSNAGVSASDRMSLSVQNADTPLSLRNEHQ